MNFFDNTHPLAADNERLHDTLVPVDGKCDTMQGELIRATTKIGYDWYNNGWGCNNWSGAVVFLREFIGEFANNRTDDEKKAFHTAMSTVDCYSHGEPCHISDQRADELITTIIAYVVQCVLDNPTPEPNTRDMYDFTEPSYQGGDDDYDDDDYDEETGRYIA